MIIIALITIYGISSFIPISGTQCLSGWYSYNTGCYHLVPFDDPWNLVTWATANQTCSSVLQGTSAANQNSHLLFIETPDELVRISKCLFESRHEIEDVTVR